MCEIPEVKKKKKGRDFKKANTTNLLSPKRREFTKRQWKGRLSHEGLESHVQAFSLKCYEKPLKMIT